MNRIHLFAVFAACTSCSAAPDLNQQFAAAIAAQPVPDTPIPPFDAILDFDELRDDQKAIIHFLLNADTPKNILVRNAPGAKHLYLHFDAR